MAEEIFFDRCFSFLLNGRETLFPWTWSRNVVRASILWQRADSRGNLLCYATRHLFIGPLLKKKKFYPRLGHFSSTNVIWIEFDGSNVTMTCECVIFQRAEMKAHLIRFQLRHGVDISVSLCVCLLHSAGNRYLFWQKKKGREMSREREKENIDGRRRQFPPPAPPRELCSCWMRPRRDYKTCARLWGRRARPPQTIDLCRDDEDLPLWKPRTRHT